MEIVHIRFIAFYNIYSNTIEGDSIMKHVPKETTDESLIQEFLNNGGKISHGKTKPPAAELGLSNNQWNNKLTKEEKAVRDKKA